MKKKKEWILEGRIAVTSTGRLLQRLTSVRSISTAANSAGSVFETKERISLIYFSSTGRDASMHFGQTHVVSSS